ncbi:MAG: YjjG family noncanonical pyrimidine nucleotidase [Thermoanaerobaculia bacterium]
MTCYRWLLFDADGTLFDYDTAEAAALAATWESLGLEPPPGLVDAYRRINAELWQVYEAGGISQTALQVERFVRLIGELGGSADPSRLSRGYLRYLARQTDLLEGARELLDWLDGRFRLALITNGIPEVQRPRIGLSGFDRLFPVVVISGEEGVAKPAPEIFDVALRRMGDPRRQEVLLIGDSLSSDIRGGVDYGLDTCWYNPDGLELGDGPEPRYQIRRLGELRGIVGEASPPSS